MKIGITGVTGFIGRRVRTLAVRQGHEVIGYTSHPKNPVPGCIETRRFAPGFQINVHGCDALIHLAGENIFGIWTHEKKRRIFRSRKFGTRALVDAIAAAEQPPRVLVSGSAVGFYGDTGDIPADETTAHGFGFLADVCVAWETEANRARDFGVRVVLPRTGIVLGKSGGALAKMTPIFRAGLGGKIGDGTQWMPWIHLDDEAALLLYAAENDALSGAVNAVAPEPVRNVDFTRELAQTLHRPAFFTVPGIAVKTAMGELSHELLDSKRIVPRVALAADFSFQFPRLDSALAEIFTDKASH